MGDVMALANNENGQILLSGAFLFAIAIAITAIMLNNMIYTNNVAYTGFSEQSIYDDSSLKQMMIDEINYEYYTSNGNQSWFTSNMTTFVNVTNNMTLTKGVYLNNILSYYHPLNIPKPSFQPDVVSQQIYIYGKNFDKSYNIVTNYTKKPALTNNAPRNNQGNVIIKLGANNTTTQNAVFIVDVVNSTTYLPEPHVIICVFVNGIRKDPNDFITDENGRKYFTKSNLVSLGSGPYDIYVTVMNFSVVDFSQRSNIITIGDT